MSKNISDLSGRKGLEKNLFEELGIAAQATGTPNKDALEKLCNEFLVGKSTVYGTVSFYDFLRPENQGKKVYVCNGSACLTAGTQDKIYQQLAPHFNATEIGEKCVVSVDATKTVLFIAMEKIIQGKILMLSIKLKTKNQQAQKLIMSTQLVLQY